MFVYTVILYCRGSITIVWRTSIRHNIISLLYRSKKYTYILLSSSPSLQSNTCVGVQTWAYYTMFKRRQNVKKTTTNETKTTTSLTPQGRRADCTSTRMVHLHTFWAEWKKRGNCNLIYLLRILDNYVRNTFGKKKTRIFNTQYNGNYKRDFFKCFRGNLKINYDEWDVPENRLRVKVVNLKRPLYALV